MSTVKSEIKAKSDGNRTIKDSLTEIESLSLSTKFMESDPVWKSAKYLQDLAKLLRSMQQGPIQALIDLDIKQAGPTERQRTEKIINAQKACYNIIEELEWSLTQIETLQGMLETFEVMLKLKQDPPNREELSRLCNKLKLPDSSAIRTPPRHLFIFDTPEIIKDVLKEARDACEPQASLIKTALDINEKIKKEIENILDILANEARLTNSPVNDFKSSTALDVSESKNIIKTEESVDTYLKKFIDLIKSTKVKALQQFANLTKENLTMSTLQSAEFYCSLSIRYEQNKETLESILGGDIDYLIGNRPLIDNHLRIRELTEILGGLKGSRIQRLEYLSKVDVNLHRTGGCSHRLLYRI